MGTLYHGDDDRLLGFDAVGPSELLPRAHELRRVRRRRTPCSSRAPTSSISQTPWVMQSLFLTAIGEARDRGVKAIETFGYRYPEGETAYERFLVHRTIFPADFLADFGFFPVRWEGRVTPRPARAVRAPAGRRGKAGTRAPEGEGGLRPGTGSQRP